MRRWQELARLVMETATKGETAQRGIKMGNISDRMTNALLLADKCWERANKTAPEFVEEYLRIAEEKLRTVSTIRGEEFKKICAQNGLRRPPELHPNTWVSGVRVLKNLGWITAMYSVPPEDRHNHMPSVTLWRSNVYFETLREGTRDDTELPAMPCPTGDAQSANNEGEGVQVEVREVLQETSNERI